MTYIGRFEADAGLQHTSRKIDSVLEQLRYSFPHGAQDIPEVALMTVLLEQAKVKARDLRRRFDEVKSSEMEDYLRPPITIGMNAEVNRDGQVVEVVVIGHYIDLLEADHPEMVSLAGNMEDWEEGRFDVPVSEVKVLSELEWRAKHPACSVAGPGCTGRDEVQVRENPFDADMYGDNSQHPICQTCYEFLVDEL
jgi:hypothetical protein